MTLQSGEDKRYKKDRRTSADLGRYYDAVIECLHDSTSILILDPGEAKSELRKRLDVHGLGACVVSIEAADKLSDDQIVAKVQHYFQESPHASNTTLREQTTKERRGYDE